MKKIAAIAALLIVLSYSADAQLTRGNFGTYMPATTTQMNTYNAQGVSKNFGKDTLSNGDTGYVWIGLPSRGDYSFDLVTTVLTGTVSTTANVLQGTNDSSAYNANWLTITGITTQCASCVGASSTTTPSGSATHYIWQVPMGQGASWKYYRIRTIQTGTVTATYRGYATQKY